MATPSTPSDTSTPTRLSISGPALAALLTPAQRAERYCDGLLLGCSRRVRARLGYTDAREGGDLHSSAAPCIDVAAPVPLPCTCSFYDARGRVDEAKLSALSEALGISAGCSIVGWFVVRPPQEQQQANDDASGAPSSSSSPLLPSLREAAVTRSLQQWLSSNQNKQHARSVFCCIESRREHGGATTTAAYRFFEAAPEQGGGAAGAAAPSQPLPLRALPCHVANLGHAAWLRESGRLGGGGASSLRHQHHHDAAGRHRVEEEEEDGEEDEEDDGEAGGGGAAALAELDGPSLAALRQAAAAAASPAVEGVYESLLQQLEQALAAVERGSGAVSAAWGRLKLGGGGPQQQQSVQPSEEIDRLLVEVRGT